MTLAAIILVLISTFMHATWNLLARKQRSEMAFISKMLVFIMSIGLVPFAISEMLYPSITARGWLLAGCSGVCGATYLYSLARAYHLSDFTVVYPIARALPVLLVGLADVVRGRYLASMAWTGLLLVASGCVIIPLDSFRKISLKRYMHRSMLWMLLAASGTVGYSVIDKIASEIISSGPGSAIKYCYLFFSFSGMIFLTARRLIGTEIQKINQISSKAALLGGGCFFGSYGLVLWAFQMGRHASYVVAFRQFSIIIGVVSAFVIYKERGVLVRIAGAILITTGLIIVGVFGKL